MIVTTSAANAGVEVGNAWCREARRVLDLAAQRGFVPDREIMVLADVRDLQRMAERLRAPSRRSRLTM